MVKAEAEEAMMSAARQEIFMVEGFLILWDDEVRIVMERKKKKCVAPRVQTDA